MLTASRSTPFDLSAERSPHPCCWQCWIRMFPRHAPMQVVDRKSRACCFCGRHTRDGITADSGSAPPFHQEHA